MSETISVIAQRGEKTTDIVIEDITPDGVTSMARVYIPALDLRLDPLWIDTGTQEQMIAQIVSAVQESWSDFVTYVNDLRGQSN